MPQDVLLQLLQALDTDTARNMLSDLRDPDRRTPQLYNAIGKLLERHKFAIQRLQPDAGLLGELAAALDQVPELTEDELVRH
ncbi:DNA packaging protein [Pseudomonas sp. SID14000]|uniref:DNA packaging protein n=1 Tax=Pseudomonas sp. SID14000 TaxID=1986221 RepID=UPI000B3D03B1|nr:DNA packaging protein [Pseudomonas sp. SID14000]